MSWYDFNSSKNSTTLSVVLHYQDTSYQITSGVTVPECNQSTIDIDFNSNDVVTSITHYNDFGTEEEFNSVEDLLDYIQDNWEEVSENEVSSLRPIIKELDFSKIFKTRKVA